MAGETKPKSLRNNLYAVQEDSFVPLGSHVANTTISSATELVPAAGATKLLIQALTQNVRYTIDGTDPTGAIGFLITANDPPGIIYLGSDMTLKVIEETATASLQYQWGK